MPNKGKLSIPTQFPPSLLNCCKHIFLRFVIYIYLFVWLYIISYRFLHSLHYQAFETMSPNYQMILDLDIHLFSRYKWPQFITSCIIKIPPTLENCAPGPSLNIRQEWLTKTSFHFTISAIRFVKQCHRNKQFILGRYSHLWIQLNAIPVAVTWIYWCHKHVPDFN